MDGAPILSIEMAQNKDLQGCSASLRRTRPVAFRGIPTLARVAAWGGEFPLSGRRNVGEIGLSGAPRFRTASIALEQP